MKAKNILQICTIIIIATIFSCGNNNSSFFSTIVKSNQKNFTGNSIGKTIHQVKLEEDSTFLLDDLEGYLLYDYAIDSANSYTVTYDFTQNSLYAIEVSVYLEKIKDAKLLYQEFKKYFTQKYGKGKLADDKYMVWKKYSPKQGEIEFAMKEDSEEYGFLSIKISNTAN